MSYVFNFEVMSNGVCVNKINNFLQFSKNVENDTAVCLANRVSEADAWDYVNAICFKEMKDGKLKQLKTVRFDNPAKSLKATVVENSNAPMWHTNFVQAVQTWGLITNAVPTNKTVAQQFIEAENLNLTMKVSEKVRNNFTFFVFDYTWKSFEDKTLFTLKY